LDAQPAQNERELADLCQRQTRQERDAAGISHEVRDQRDDGTLGGHATYTLSKGEFSGGTGVTYIYKGRAERPRHANDRLVGYELLPIYDHWWLPSVSGSERGRQMFDDYYQYVAYGGRPVTSQRQIAGCFLGRMHSSNKAKPFWGWHDVRTNKKNVIAPGQWGLDPAYSVAQNLRIPGPFSLDYIYNPYLGFGTPDRTITATPAPPVETTAIPVPAASAPPVDVRPAAATTTVFDKHLELLRLGGYQF
jgi:hypothetical protein